MTEEGPRAPGFDPWQKIDPETYSSLALVTFPGPEHHLDSFLQKPNPSLPLEATATQPPRDKQDQTTLIALPTQGGWLAASLTQALAWEKSLGSIPNPTAPRYLSIQPTAWGHICSPHASSRWE